MKDISFPFLAAVKDRKGRQFAEAALVGGGAGAGASPSVKYAEGMEFLLDVVDRFPVQEEFADSLDHPDPVPLVYMMENGGANPEIGQADSGMAEMVCDGVLTDAQGGARRRRDESHTRSAQSIDRVNPEAPGWTKRHRLGSAPPGRVPCPSRMSALELSIRKYAKHHDKSVVRPELGLSFDSLEGKCWAIFDLFAVCPDGIGYQIVDRRRELLHRGLDLRLRMRLDLGLDGSMNHLSSRIALMDCKSKPGWVPSGLVLCSDDLLMSHPPSSGHAIRGSSQSAGTGREDEDDADMAAEMRMKLGMTEQWRDWGEGRVNASVGRMGGGG
uniref:Uncharacterized protein n=1 Tax=Aegilops tauschii TaxID=37682 RepID=M8BKF6_AEGTA